MAEVKREERRISPAIVIIPIGLGLAAIGVLVTLTIVNLGR